MGAVRESFVYPLQQYAVSYPGLFENRATSGMTALRHAYTLSNEDSNMFSRIDREQCELTNADKLKSEC